MINKKAFLTLFALAFLSMLSSEANAQEVLAPGAPALKQQALKNLDLSADQKKKLEAIKDDGLKDQFKGFAQERQKLNDLMRNKKSSAKDILSQAKKVQAAEAGMLEERVKRTLEVREVLSDEQWEKLVTIITERRKGMMAGGRPGAANRGPGAQAKDEKGGQKPM